MRVSLSCAPSSSTSLVRVTRYRGVESSIVRMGRKPIRLNAWSRPSTLGLSCGVIISTSAARCSASSRTIVFDVFMSDSLRVLGDTNSAAS